MEIYTPENFFKNLQTYFDVSSFVLEVNPCMRIAPDKRSKQKSGNGRRYQENNNA